jgi:tRNA(Ile)-lysidine synthase
MSTARWHRLASLVRCAEASSVNIGAGITVRLTDSTMILLRGDGEGKKSRETAIKPGEPIPIDLPGSVTWRGATIETVVDPEQPHDETVDLDRIVPPLCVRGAVAGDRFDPLGLGGRSQGLNDFFRARKVLRAERPLTPLLCDGAGIIWVVGHRIAERVKVREETVRTLGLRRG